MATVTNEGLQTRTFQEILDGLIEKHKLIYGNDVALLPDTPDGQWLGILAQEIYDTEQVMSAIVMSQDPSGAVGRWLDYALDYGGLQRKVGEATRLPGVVITGTPGQQIPAGYLAKAMGQTWEIASPATIQPIGYVIVDFLSVNAGSFAVPGGTELDPQVILPGVVSVITSVASVVGAERERDATARNRLMARKILPNQNLVEKLGAALGQLTGVNAAIVYENPTDVVDSIGVPAHAIWAIVDGGTDEDIARTIFQIKSAGCNMRGLTEVLITDSQGVVREIKFDRFTPVGLQANVNIKLQEFVQAVNVDDVEEALTSAVFTGGQDVYYSRVISILNQVPGFYIDTMTIGKVGGPQGTSNVAIAANEIARFTNVTVTLVP